MPPGGFEPPLHGSADPGSRPVGDAAPPPSAKTLAPDAWRMRAGWVAKCRQLPRARFGAAATEDSANYVKYQRPQLRFVADLVGGEQSRLGRLRRRLVARVDLGQRLATLNPIPPL